jgi:O-antigen ligase
MIRVGLVWLVALGLSVYAWKDWYRSLCVLILLLAVVQHRSFPNGTLGIPGLNPWNVGLVFVVLAWACTRSREGLSWDMPRLVNGLLLIYLAVVLVSFGRLMVDVGPLAARYGIQVSKMSLINDYLLNTVKWVIPGLLLYDGCRTRSRLHLALGAVLVLYLLLGLQVIKALPPHTALSRDLDRDALRLLSKHVGYHRVNLSMMLAGASWAILAALPLIRRPILQFGVIGASVSVALAQALTGGRMGYMTWGAVGLALGLLKWRRYLLIAPAIVGIVLLALPNVADRALQGFSGEDQGLGASQFRGQVDVYAITAGRNLAWPVVLEQFRKSPLIGFGRLAMQRTGITERLVEEAGEPFGHPHNAYLEWLLENGIVGFILVMPFYLLMLWYSLNLFRSRGSPDATAAGGVAAALILALLVASMGSQTFYPKEGAVGMWCAIGLMLRVRMMGLDWTDRAASASVPVEWWRPQPAVGPATVGAPMAGRRAG